MLKKMFHLFLKDKMQTRHLCIDFVLIDTYTFRRNQKKRDLHYLFGSVRFWSSNAVDPVGIFLMIFSFLES